MRIKFLLAVPLFLILIDCAHARTKLRVEKKAIFASAPTTAGTVIVWGRPGSVNGAHPINVMAFNGVMRAGGGGLVRSDGSFSVSLPGSGDDKIRVKFTAANRKNKSVILKVPEIPVVAPVVVGTETVTEEIEVVEPLVSTAVEDEEVTVTEDEEVTVAEEEEAPVKAVAREAVDDRKGLEEKYPDIIFHWMKEAPYGSQGTAATSAPAPPPAVEEAGVTAPPVPPPVVEEKQPIPDGVGVPDTSAFPPAVEEESGVTEEVGVVE